MWDGDAVPESVVISGLVADFPVEMRCLHAVLEQGLG